MFKRTDFVKRVFAVLMSLLLVLSLMYSNPITASAATVAMPILPYVPPETTQVMDYLFNAYGATAPDIDSTVDKIKAYMKLYETFLGVTWQSAWSDLQDVINAGKTSGKILVPASVQGVLNGVISYAINNGMQYGESYPASLTAAQWQERLLSQYGITISSSACNNIYSARATNYQTNKESYLVYAVGKVHGSNLTTITFATMATMYGNDARWTKYSNNFYYPMYPTGMLANRLVSVMFYTYEWMEDSRTVGSLINGGTGTIALDLVQEQGTTGVYVGTVTPIFAQNTQIGQGLVNGAVHAISAYTTLKQDGTIDDTKPDVIPMPLVDVVPATTVSDLTAAQEENGVSPALTEEDVQQLLQQLKQQQAISYGTADQYALDLTQYFPFCLPFDAGNILTAFIAEPEAPHITYTLDNPFSDDSEDDIVIDIDLSIFDEVAAILRTLESILFVIGLCAVTRSLYLRG